MPESVITYRGTVYPWHCDHMGHMNVMWYVGKFDEATWQFFNHLGLAPSRLSQEGAGMAAVEQHIEYRRELHAGQVITVRSTVLEVTDKSIRFAHEMTNDENGEVVARTTLTGVYIDTSLRKARPLPSEIKESLRLLVAITPRT